MCASAGTGMGEQDTDRNGSKSTVPAERMQSAHKAEMEALLLGKMQKSELEEKITSSINAYGGLLTRDAALFLIAKENGLIKERIVTLAEIRPEMRSANFTATVLRIFPEQKFERTGKVFRTVRVLLEDKSATSVLVLWNEGVELTRGKIGIGDLVQVKGAYLRNEELHLSSTGSMELLEHCARVELGKLKEGVFCAIGRITEIYPEYYYMRNEKEDVMASFEMEDSSGRARAVVWHEPDRVTVLAAGDEVKLENAVCRNNELHVGAYSRIVVLNRKKHEGVIEGTLESLSAIESFGGIGGTPRAVGEKESAIIAKIGEKEVLFEGEKRFSVLKIGPLPPDISIGTVLELKKDKLIGMQMAVRVKEEKGRLRAEEIL